MVIVRLSQKFPVDIRNIEILVPEKVYVHKI